MCSRSWALLALTFTLTIQLMAQTVYKEREFPVLGQISAQKTYSVTGKIVDAETGEPVSNARLGYLVEDENLTKAYGANKPVMKIAKPADGVTTNASGEFEFLAMPSGQYLAFVDHRQMQGEFYSGFHPFKVGNDNVARLEIKARRGSSISGKIVIEGTTDPAKINALRRTNLQFDLEMKLPAMDNLPSSVTRYGEIRPDRDGNFRVAGLKPESVHFNKLVLPKGWNLLRIEHESAQVLWLDLKPNEHLSDVRFVMGYGTATLLGQLKIVGGALPENLVVYVQGRHTANSSLYLRESVDKQGQFVMKNLVAGEYELTTGLGFKNGARETEESRRLSPLVKKNVLVSVSDDGEVKTTIIIDLGQ